MMSVWTVFWTLIAANLIAIAITAYVVIPLHPPYRRIVREWEAAGRRLQKGKK